MCEIYQNGWTPLIYAARYDHLPVVEYLVERGADIEAKNKVCDVIISYETIHTSHMKIYIYIMCEMYQDGFTPLIWTARNGHLPMVEYLVERGADMEAKGFVSDVII